MHIDRIGNLGYAAGLEDGIHGELDRGRALAIFNDNYIGAESLPSWMASAFLDGYTFGYTDGRKHALYDAEVS